MKTLTYVEVDGLKVGDVVGYCTYPSLGWGKLFRYPIVHKKIIERITPKRTKFVLDGNVELDIWKAKMLVVYDDEAKRQSAIAESYADLKDIQWKIEKASKNNHDIIGSKITDEELMEYYNYLKNIASKYLNED